MKCVLQGVNIRGGFRTPQRLLPAYSAAFIPPTVYWRVFSASCLVALLFTTALCMAHAAEAPAAVTSEAPETRDLTELSLEDLLDVEVKVTSASKKSEALFDASAAIYVITAEDIRRSGATSIVEALRLAPGLHVARIDANKWAVSSRGFSDRFSNKLLVLIDGRSVYTPSFAGVWWDVQGALMEDIDRIEVIRGPGATLWGANAVNGVINIITKSASKTADSFVTSTVESGDRTIQAARYGGKLGDHGFLRVYGKYFSDGGFVSASGDTAADRWRQERTGFRMDWERPGKRSTMLQGEMYQGHSGGTWTRRSYTPPYYTTFDDVGFASGGNLVARGSRVVSDFSEVTWQAYYDRTNRRDFLADDSRDTIDLEFQKRGRHRPGHEVTYGFNYRWTSDKIGATPIVSYDPSERSLHLMSAFAQEDMVLKPNRLRLTFGSKLESTHYTGMEIEPNVRLLWTPDRRRAGWLAVSRAVRTPSRFDRDGTLTSGVYRSGGSLYEWNLIGNSDFRSEELVSHEVGYRVRPTRRSSVDIAGFYNVYRHLRTFELGQWYIDPSPVPHVVLPYFVRNGARGKTYGGEVAANWNLTRAWNLSAAFTWLGDGVETSLDEDEGFVGSEYQGNTPHTQFQMRSYLDLPNNLELDVMLYSVRRLPSGNTPGFNRLDIQLGWRPPRGPEISLVGRNLLSPSHREYDSVLGEHPTEVPRSIYAKIAWRL
ncbi:MAG: TonB-dependent receptor plug domain-containing protein [Armatimonadota bacterium]|nr:TonB-dependent receptor plug domain-containing protein [Armatimonadota bacterium]